VKHTGDGIMASLGSVQSGLRSAGEPVSEGDDLFGAAVQLAARLCDYADPGMIVVSGVVRDLAIGKGFAFGPGREAILKGFPDAVTLCEVTWSVAT
jgi:adenylate cyclase